MKKITFINISFLILFLGVGISKLSAQINPVLREKLKVYYVANPNTEGDPHLVEITASGTIFGGNENMSNAEDVVRSIFFQSTTHRTFQDSLVNILQRYTQPAALIFYDDIAGGLSSNNPWANCVQNGHFSACSTEEQTDDYQRVIHYGAFQINRQGLVAVQDRILDFLRGPGNNWWDGSTPTSFNILEVCVPYYTNYARFRRSVVENSADIRRGMIYRSNPEYPEEVIDRRRDLREIHQGFRRLGIEEGQSVCLIGYVVKDSRNYVLLIRFTTRDVHDFSEEPERIAGTVNRSELITTTIQHAQRVASGISSRNPRERINCLLALAQRLGPARAYDLYTLNPLAVGLYIDMSEQHKAEELRRGLPPPNYRVYPIRELAYLIQSLERYRENDELYREALEQIDLRIHHSVWLFHRVLASGSSIYGPNFYRLRDWVRSQQENPNSIYSCYNQ